MPQTITKTQIGIIGAGPAGLTLALLLHRAGIDCIVLENRSREYVESRVRAGLQMLINTGTALNHAITISGNMKVNTEVMKNNVEQFLKNNSGK